MERLRTCFHECVEGEQCFRSGPAVQMAAGGCCNRSGRRGFPCGAVSDLSQFGPMVRDTRKAHLQSSQLGFRARLDGSVRADGLGCMAAAECKLPWVEKRTALALFFSQLVLNALWSVLFFGFHSPLGGPLNIVPQWTLIVLAILRLRRIDIVAALCLCPLALWVGFAAVLNFKIWRLNG